MGNRLIGVISDTHGIIRPEALKVLNRCDLIVHAGDIGGMHVIDTLHTIAPVVAVRGNCDRGICADAFSASELAETGGYYFYVIHDLNRMDIEPEAIGVRVVISGHTHDPCKYRKGPVLYLNPGSAGPRRLSLPVSLALLSIKDGYFETEFVELLR